ncbi:hypothetical protein R6Q59_004047 [Mikania micrantha]
MTWMGPFFPDSSWAPNFSGPPLFTIFTFLLFAISTPSIALDHIDLLRSNVYKSLTEYTIVADSKVVIPTDKRESKLDKNTANELLPESEKSQIFDVSTIDPTPRLIFSRSYPIQRNFDRTTRIPLRFVRRHPCRMFKKTFMIPTKVSYGNDMILSDKTTSVEPETLGDQIPTKSLEFKHKYGHSHHHYQHDDNKKFEMKKKEHKGGFMKRIRKFLKHTFD